MRAIQEILKNLPENIRLPIYEAFQAFEERVIQQGFAEIKSEIKEVWKAIGELAEAQKRTEEKVRELAEAQKRTEQRVNELAEAQKRTEQRVNELAEAQKRTDQALESFKKTTEENFNKVWNAINELTEAQKRTEQRVNELAEAQKRTEERVEKLAQKVEQLTIALSKLTEDHRKTREQLGGLSHAFGYVLEDRAIKSLPKILKKYNIEIVGELKRDYLEINGEYIEVNIYGKAKKNGNDYLLVGEAKSRVSKRVIDEFLKKCEKISKESIKILVSYLFPPEIKKYAEEKGIILIYSYELEL